MPEEKKYYISEKLKERLARPMLRFEPSPAGQEANENNATAATNAEIGDKMPDGTIYAGISPDTNKPMYTTEADTPFNMSWTDAKNLIEKDHMYGHKDWRLPTKGELNVMFNNRAAIGGRSRWSEWIWSSYEDNDYAGIQSFSTGLQTRTFKSVSLSARFVRG